MIKDQTFKLPSINGLRAISITLVILNHLNANYNIFGILKQNIWTHKLHSLITDGQFGVNVFFVISGFLISSLLIREETKYSQISLKKFYLRRTLRIFPAFYFLLLIYAGLQFLGHLEISSNSWLTALTYTKYFNWQSELDWVTRHAWSLSIEEHFYIFWPLIFMGGDRFRKIASISLIIIAPIFRTYDHFYTVEWINSMSIFYRVDAIAIGCFVALYQHKILKLCQNRWTTIFWVSTLLIIGLRSLPVLFKSINLGFIFIPLGLTYGTIANILISSIMLYTVFGPKKLVFKILNSKILNFVGLLSYSLYLWQQIFLSGNSAWITSFPQNLLFIFVMAMFSYYLVEKPFLIIKKRFSRQATK
jgi:peptidoglycan/LPS O-acetylase OafA/YrhL